VPVIEARDDAAPLAILPGALLDASPALVARFGASRRVHSVRYSAATTMTALVDKIAAQLAAAAIARADVLGSSYGGWVAQCLARRHPRLVRHLILVHTFALRASDAKRFRAGLALWGVMPDVIMRKLGMLRVRRLLRPMQQSSPEEHARLEAALVAEIDSPATIEQLHRQNLCMLESCTAFTVAPGDLAQHDGRVLIIESDDDPAIRARDRAHLRAMYPQAHVRTFHGTGHVTSRAAPEELAAAVESFLAEPAAETIPR
jgi:pimeloyl-ACP methyl ester carboxylesterase